MSKEHWSTREYLEWLYHAENPIELVRVFNNPETVSVTCLRDDRTVILKDEQFKWGDRTLRTDRFGRCPKCGIIYYVEAHPDLAPELCPTCGQPIRR